MFTYLGIVQSGPDGVKPGSSITYQVKIPALYQNNVVPAKVSIFPGIQMTYQQNDVVIITDFDGKSQDEMQSYFILGLLYRRSTQTDIQKLENPTAQEFRKLAYADIEHAYIEGGNIAGDTQLDGSSTTSVKYVLNTLEDLKKRVATLEDEVDVLQAKVEEITPKTIELPAHSGTLTAAQIATLKSYPEIMKVSYGGVLCTCQNVTNSRLTYVSVRPTTLTAGEQTIQAVNYMIIEVHLANATYAITQRTNVFAQ